MSSGNAPSSICPKNWRLPIGGAAPTVAGDATDTNNEFSKLDIAMGGTGQDKTSSITYTNWITDGIDGKHMNLPLSGYYNNVNNNSVWMGSGTSGYLWASTAYSSTNAWIMALYSSNSRVRPDNSSNVKPYIFNIRCLVDN
jgi:uncharacterized protein (TIGR02145 family)